MYVRVATGFDSVQASLAVSCLFSVHNLRGYILETMMDVQTCMDICAESEWTSISTAPPGGKQDITTCFHKCCLGVLTFLFVLYTSRERDIIAATYQPAIGQESTRYPSWSCQEWGRHVAVSVYVNDFTLFFLRKYISPLIILTRSTLPIKSAKN